MFLFSFFAVLVFLTSIVVDCEEELYFVEGTIRVLATHDFLEIKNARFEVLLELESSSSSAGDKLPSSIDNDDEEDFDDEEDTNNNNIINSNDNNVLHLPSRLVQQYHLQTGDRVALSGRVLNRTQMDDVRVPFRHTYVHRYLNVSTFQVNIIYSVYSVLICLLLKQKQIETKKS